MLARIKPDGFTLALLAVVLLATFLPCEGQSAIAFGWATKAAITLLFFMHGAKLSRTAIMEGIGAWQLHLAVTASTYLLFPALALLLATLPDRILDNDLKSGLLFLSILPSTVQSAIAFTSMAGGNIAAAVCSASLSNVLGVFLTPLLAGLLIHTQGAGHHDTLQAIKSVAMTLLLPFIVGHLSRPLTAGFVNRHKAMLGRLDRGSILLVVYTAFSAAVIGGLWSRVSGRDIFVILIVSSVLLMAMLLLTWRAGRFAFSRQNEIILVFGGSQKSLASGVPMAAALFPAAQVGMIILPLMLFHQVQLIACAFIARAYGSSKEAVSEDDLSTAVTAGKG